MKKKLTLILCISALLLMKGCSNWVKAEPKETRVAYDNYENLKYPLVMEQEPTEQELNTNEELIIEQEYIEDLINPWDVWHLDAWRCFRYNVSDFFDSVANLNSDWIFWIREDFLDGSMYGEHIIPSVIDDSTSREMIVSTVAFQTSRVRRIDPALYLEIMSSFDEESERLSSDENISSLVAFFFDRLQTYYESLVSFWSNQDSYERIQSPLLDEPRWIDDWDWDSRIGSSNWWEIIDFIELMFKLDSLEQGVIYIMSLMYSDGSEGLSPDCAIWIMAAVNDKVQETILEGLVDRIAALRDEGFDIYREYLEMLTDIRRVFDPRTQEAHNRIVQMIDIYIMDD